MQFAIFSRMEALNFMLAEGTTFLWVSLSALLIFILVIALTRIFGLRSYTRLSTFDFAFTLAKGALIAAIVFSSDEGFLKGALILLTIYLCEWITASLRTRYSWFNKLVSNQPVLLMYKGEYLQKNISSTRISYDDINFALRQKNIRHFNEVYAIIAEPTGQISVLTGDPLTAEYLLKGVKR